MRALFTHASWIPKWKRRWDRSADRCFLSTNRRGQSDVDNRCQNQPFREVVNATFILDWREINSSRLNLSPKRCQITCLAANRSWTHVKQAGEVALHGLQTYANTSTTLPRCAICSYDSIIPKPCIAIIKHGSLHFSKALLHRGPPRLRRSGMVKTLI